MTHDEAVAEIKAGGCPFLTETQLVDQNVEWQDALFGGGLLRQTDRVVYATEFFKYGVLFPDGTQSIRFYLPDTVTPGEYTPEGELHAIQMLYTRTMNQIFKVLNRFPGQTGLLVGLGSAVYRVIVKSEWALVRTSISNEPITRDAIVFLEFELDEWKSQNLPATHWFSMYQRLANAVKSPQLVDISDEAYRSLGQQANL